MLDSYLDINPVEAALRYKQSEEFAEIRRILSQKETNRLVLDLGAGNGVLSFALAECGYQVWALEPGDGAVTGRKAMERIQDSTGIRFEIIDGCGEKIPLQDECVDVVIARQVLHHAENLQKMCAEVYRVLKPRGLFLALREHVVFKDGDLEVFLSNHPMHRLTGQENAYPLRFYKNCIQAVGFSKLKTYAFWDTVLNYAPLRKREVKEMFARKISQKFHFFPLAFFPLATGARYILEIPGVSYLLSQVLNKIFKTPGTLYSFQAVK
jgi:ubiquinone/menaquinone biosynthesis C-methylase UbiE